MTENRLKWLLAAAILVLVLVVYRLTSAPTASFWDCGELIACSYIVGIPHPPGTPLFVMLGRIFSLLPTAREPASRVGFLTSLFGAITCVLVYLVVVKLLGLLRAVRLQSRASGERRPGAGSGPAAAEGQAATPASADRPAGWSLPYIAGAVGALSLAFAFSFWDNSVETEVYGPVTTVALLLILLALSWRERVEQGISDNRLVLVSIFLVVLSTGIHFTPMLVVFALIVFWLLVERKSVLDLRLIEFAAGFLVILTLDSMVLAGAGLPVIILVMALMLGFLVLAVRVMERYRKPMAVVYGLLALFGMFVVAYLAGLDARTGRDLIVDDVVLFLASPVSAVIERWFANRVLLLVFAVAYLAYLFWLQRRKRLDVRYVGLGLFVLLFAGTVQYILMVRAAQHPGINEADPQTWDALVGVLKREQYDPMKLYPRKTMFASEGDYLRNTNARLGLVAGYFEQVKSYVRYLLWQWAGRENLDVLAYSQNWWRPFLALNPIPALFGLIPPLFGLLGIIRHWREDRKSFFLLILAFLVSSIGLLTYLNLKLSPSDPRHLLFDESRGEGMHFVEVRERDYFFAFSFVFYAVFIGLGVHAFLSRVLSRRPASLIRQAIVVATVLVSFLPLAFNLREANRAGDWIPAEYGYDMLASCEDPSVLFTNGDNDTFPLWFVQQVPTRIAGYRPGFKKPDKPRKGVQVANLSLINTDWYLRQLIDWGAPLSFDRARFDSLPQSDYYGPDGRRFFLKDLAIRDMLATNCGIRLRWGKEYRGAIDPRTRQPVLAYRDEYQQARNQYSAVMKPVFEQAQTAPARGSRPAAQEFLAANQEYLAWLQAQQFSIAGLELTRRLPAYQELVRRNASLDSLVREKRAFESWLNRGDYAMPVEEFQRYVIANYPSDEREAQMPIYFATTVMDEYMRDIIRGDSIYLLVEGLVQRVVPELGPRPASLRTLNARRTQYLLDSVYVTRSMSDRKVQKDHNARGMFGNFVLARVKLAEQYYAESGRFDLARIQARKALELDLELGHRAALYDELARYSYLLGDYPQALSFMDSLEGCGDEVAMRQRVLLIRAFICQLQGDYARATALTEELPARPQELAEIFASFYALYARYRGFDYPHQVLRRWREFNPRDSLPILIGQGLEQASLALSPRE